MRELAAVGILAAAIIMDVRSGRISNRLIAAGLLTGFVLQIAAHGAAGICIWFSGVSVPVILCSVLFLMHALGAGDVKLFSVVGGLIGLESMWYCLLFSFVAGALLACLKMIRKKIFWSRIFYFLNYVQQVWVCKKLLPYEESKDKEKKHADHIMHFSIAIGLGYGICRGYFLWVK